MLEPEGEMDELLLSVLVVRPDVAVFGKRKIVSSPATTMTATTIDATKARAMALWRDECRIKIVQTAKQASFSSLLKKKKQPERPGAIRFERG